jgi:hypothetical protein
VDVHSVKASGTGGGAALRVAGSARMRTTEKMRSEKGKVRKAEDARAARCD